MTTPAKTIPSLRLAQREMAQTRILSAARAVFMMQGVAEASIDAIAQHAGVGRATVYRHFSGKDALLLGLVEEDWDRQAALFAKLGREADPDARAVTDWLRLLVRATRARRDSMRLYSTVLGELADMADRLAAHRLRLVAALGEHITAFAAPPPRQRVEALLLVMQIEQFCVYAAVSASEADIEVATELVAARILDFAFRPSPSPVPPAA